MTPAQQQILNQSDGLNTYNDLYEHRTALIVFSMVSNNAISWMAKYGEDGTEYKGFFVGGMKLPTGQVTWHLPMIVWDTLAAHRIKSFEFAPSSGCDNPRTVLSRIWQWIGKK